jgi:hypothetical protein
VNDASSQHARVRELLGREPQGQYDVVVSDAHGDPVVLCNAPFLDDGTPMPTRYWLIGPEEIRRVGQLEAAGGVNAAEADIDPDELADAHARYAAERDAQIPDDHTGPRPSGGVGGTRLGVKCLHAHWAWHLAGGDDPVGRWIAAHLDPPTDDAIDMVSVQADHTLVQHGSDADIRIPWGSDTLTDRWLRDHDPPRPDALTNALGTIIDHLDDIIREHPAFIDVTMLEFAGPTIESLARVEMGSDLVPESVELTRDAAEEIFRMVATEAACDRAHNPGLPSLHVETIVATCSIVLSFMRRLHLDRITLRTQPQH